MSHTSSRTRHDATTSALSFEIVEGEEARDEGKGGLAER